MNTISKELSDEEIRQASEWFATLKPAVWTKVVEAATVPKTFVGQDCMRFAQPGNVPDCRSSSDLYRSPTPTLQRWHQKRYRRSVDEKKPVAQLNDEDIVAIAAYVASQAPSK